ncbi:hypothetical protein BJG93_36445 (plasmid) [Paraburkholderia sprentiae WSM5005]|uniref:Uncharacterized protein n=1 Tax=Paraburkholderia sprentiae WSM5005 TaxID=754502 RepID=A0A8F4QIA3_9BURK|nr:hypothetical protein [Paraburkholderia sprentiae]QXE07352.1 hypothetical protein BJG93_36445 [Paraburkholderia sprentiae WSM5005]
MVPNRIIPVIFVPGIMGTNLATKNFGQSQPVWLLDSTATVKSWMTKGPAYRQRVLDPEKTQVHDGGVIPSGTAQSETELRRRG